jgi:hypothetical protein
MANKNRPLKTPVITENKKARLHFQNAGVLFKNTGVYLVKN